MDKEKHNSVVIYVAGQRFPLITDDTEEYLIKTGDIVDKRIRNIGLGNPRLSANSCAILAALDYCDEEQKTKALLAEKDEQITICSNTIIKMQTEIDRLKKQVELNKQQIDTLNEQNEKLLNDTKELYLQHQKRELVPNKTIISGGHIQKTNNVHTNNGKSTTPNPSDKKINTTVNAATKPPIKSTPEASNQKGETKPENSTDNDQFSLFED